MPMKSKIPLFQNKHYQSPAVFKPQNLLRESRRQKSLPGGKVPQVCVLDPDGDIVRYLLRNNLAKRHPAWACYHTDLYQFRRGRYTLGIIGCAVGGSFAALLAEQLFVSGCQLLVSITSAGQILPVRPPPYFVLIEKALRDEGTSYHYLPPGKYAHINRALGCMLQRTFEKFQPSVECGSAWTTDAPYRETAEAIAAAHAEKILAVEMEAASLYAFAQARQKQVVCFAHITNRMGMVPCDFEKGEADGSRESLRLIDAVVAYWRKKRIIKRRL
jgi:uridine phosphorylase